MTMTGKTLTYCAGCGRLIPGSELEAGLSEARAEGVICISCIEHSDPKRAAEIRELSFREAERAKVSVQLMWAPPGVIPPRAARLAGEQAPAPGTVDPVSGQIGREQLGPALSPYNGPPVEFKPRRHIPWWVVGAGSLLMAVLGAVSQRLIMGAGSPPPPPPPAVPTNLPTTAILPAPDGLEEVPPPSTANPPAQPPTPSQPVPPVPPMPAPVVPVAPSAPNVEDEARAKALLSSADEVFEKAPAAAEKLYRNVLDFYPQTAAATLATLRLADLNAALDRRCQGELRQQYTRAMQLAAPETYWEMLAEDAQFQAIAARGPQAAQLKTELAAALQTKLDELKHNLTAQAPLIVGACLKSGDLARAEALLRAMDRFTDTTTIATASALHQQAAVARAAAEYQKQAPAIQARLAAAPYLRNYDQRVTDWDFSGAVRELEAAEKAGVWAEIGPGTRETMQVVAAYLNGALRDDLVSKAKQLAQSKEATTVHLRTPGPGSPVTQTGALQNWVNGDGFTQVVNGRDRRVLWRQVSAASLAELAGYRPAADVPLEEAAAAQEQARTAEMIGAIGALAVARGEISALRAETVFAGPPAWQRFQQLRIVLEGERRGAALQMRLQQAVADGAVLNALYALADQETFAKEYPAPLAFLAPEGQATLGQARDLVRAKRGGQLLIFQNFTAPVTTFGGIRVAQLSERLDADLPAGGLWLGAQGGTQRAVLRLENIKVPAGQHVQRAFLRVRGLQIDQTRPTPGATPAIAGLLSVTPLDKPVDLAHCTWEFCDTLHSVRWTQPGGTALEGGSTPVLSLAGNAVGDGLAGDAVFDITGYFDALADTDYTATGNGLLLKVQSQEPDYRIRLPDPRRPENAEWGMRIELQVVPKVEE